MNCVFKAASEEWSGVSQVNTVIHINVSTQKYSRNWCLKQEKFIIKKERYKNRKKEVYYEAKLKFCEAGYIVLTVTANKLTLCAINLARRCSLQSLHLYLL